MPDMTAQQQTLLVLRDAFKHYAELCQCRKALYDLGKSPPGGGPPREVLPELERFAAEGLTLVEQSVQAIGADRKDVPEP